MNAVTEASHLSTVAQDLEQDRQQPLQIQPLSGRIGAVVHGARLSGELAAEQFTQIHAALLRHRVLFFRGQHHLTDASHQAFGRLFGEIESHPPVPAPDGTAFLELNSQHGGRADSWHTDVTFKAAFPKVCVLRAVTLPGHGGDTVWAVSYTHLTLPTKRIV